MGLGHSRDPTVVFESSRLISEPVISILESIFFRRHSHTVINFKTSMKEGSLYTCLKAGKTGCHRYDLGVSAQMSTLKSSIDCADTVLAGRAFQRCADPEDFVRGGPTFPPIFPTLTTFFKGGGIF